MVLTSAHVRIPWRVWFLGSLKFSTWLILAVGKHLGGCPILYTHLTCSVSSVLFKQEWLT
jgi:hypothetical protein